MAAKRKKAASLGAQVIARVRAGEGALSIPAPMPVPPEVLAGLELADGVAPSPSLKEWLAFDGSWLARAYEWFDDCEAPLVRSAPVHLLAHDHNSEVFAPAFASLPGKLAGAHALPLDAGSDSMRLLILVPGPGGELPVMCIDTDDTPTIGVAAPSFDVWLAGQDGLVEDVAETYASEIARVAKFFFGKRGYADLDVEPDDETYPALLAAARVVLAARITPGVKKPNAPRPITVPALAEAKLGEAIAQAIATGPEARVAAFLAAAEERFPTGTKWRDVVLVKAVYTNDVDLAERMLAGGASPNARTYRESTVVHQAAHHPDTTMLARLLAAGGDVHAPGYAKQTPLADAARQGPIEAVRLLLAAGADPNAQNQSGETPLLEAAGENPTEQPGLVEKCRALLDCGADVNALRFGRLPTTALLQAISHHNGALAALLLDRGADAAIGDAYVPNALCSAWAWNDLVTFDRLAATGRRDEARDGRPALADLIQGDGLLPAIFDVRLQCQAEPQVVTVRLGGLARASDRWLERTAHGLAQLAAAGLLGSDVFSPELGVGVAIVDEATEKPTPDPEQRIGFYEVRLRLGGVAPAGLALWLRGVRTVAAQVLTAITIVGDAPLSGALAFDTARAERALRDPDADRYGAFPGPSIVTERAAKNVVGRIDAASLDATAGIALFARAVPEAIRLVRPRQPGNLRNQRLGAATLSSSMHVVPEGLELRPYGALSKEAASVDFAVARALFENGVRRLAALGDIHSAEWCLAVTAAPRRAPARP